MILILTSVFVPSAHVGVFIAQSDSVRVAHSCIWTWTVWWLLAAANVGVTLQVVSCRQSIFTFECWTWTETSLSYIKSIHWSKSWVKVKLKLFSTWNSLNYLFSIIIRVKSKCYYSPATCKVSPGIAHYQWSIRHIMWYSSLSQSEFCATAIEDTIQQHLPQPVCLLCTLNSPV